MSTISFRQNDHIRVVVLSGGDSDERAVSLKSGEAVFGALERRGYQVTAVDPADIAWAEVDWSRFDVAFLALHGRFGEDGTVQSILEQAGIAYTGSDADSSKLAFSKSASKERFLQFQVSTPEYVVIHEADEIVRIEQQARLLGYPLVVKPDQQGSSLGVTIVKAPNGLSDALTRCFELDAFGILETAVLGSEWTVGLFDELVLSPILIETERDFFDYRAKYEDDTTRYHFQTEHSQQVIESIETVARKAGEALNVRGVSRVDIRLDEQSRPWVLEVNTIPGFTDHSLIPKAAARMGMSFDSLCSKAVQRCLTAAAASPASTSQSDHPSLPRRHAG